MRIEVLTPAPYFTYSVETTPALGRVPFSTAAVGALGQTVFQLPLTSDRARFFRIAGTNFYDHPIPGSTKPALAQKPALGYNSWLAHGVGISESMIIGIVDSMATNGMKAAGYKYVVLDQGWSGNFRNPDGTASANASFPHGIAYLANYIHSKGLLLGLYTVPDEFYNGYFGSGGGYLIKDALTYSAWGVDYVKMDAGDNYRSSFETFANAFASTGRPLWLAPTTPNYAPWLTPETSSWRGNGGVHGLTDLVPVGVTVDGQHFTGWEIFLDHVDFIAQYVDTAGPGHWNDPDALDISVGPPQVPAFNSFAKPEMAMFSILSCDLMWDYVPPAEGAQMRSLYYMTNSEVLAVDQDPAGLPGRLVATNSSGLGQAWCKPLAATNGNVKAVCLFNRSTNTTQTVSFAWNSIGLTNGPAIVRDLFLHANVGIFTNGYSATLGPRDCQLVTVTSTTNGFLHPGTNYLSDQGYLAGWTNGSTAMFEIPGTLWPSTDNSESGTPLSINHKTYAKGIGVLANSRLEYSLGRQATRFHAEIGIDDQFYFFSRLVFWVWLDGNLLYDSGIMVNGSATQSIDIDVTGGNTLVLQVVTAESGGTAINDSANWANAYVLVPAR